MMEKRSRVAVHTTNEAIHYALLLCICVIIVSGIMGRAEFLRQVFEMLSPLSYWVARNMPLIDEVVQRRPDWLHARYYLSVVYIVCFSIYIHMVTASMIAQVGRKICYTSSRRGHSKFLCDTIYSKFSAIANPGCLLFVSRSQNECEMTGTLADGLSYYASRLDILATYLLMAYVLFISSFFIDSVVSTGGILSLLNPHITCLLVVAMQIGLASEMAIHITAKATIILRLIVTGDIK